MLGASVASDLSLDNLAEYEDDEFDGSSGWIWVDTANAEIAQNLTAVGLQPWFLAPTATRQVLLCCCHVKETGTCPILTATNSSSLLDLPSRIGENRNEC